ncbi:MAG: cytochrome c [Cyclobacteriaceae bacterium]|nr:cytochrome c [Cyclobacteriaceae bacterium]
MNRWVVLLFGSILIWGCGPGGKSRDSKFQQYIVQGEELYVTHCSNCHQKSGKGLGLLYPPLDESDFMDQNIDSVICLIKNGKSGEIIVNGKAYNQPMPGVPLLSDLEVAEIATYIYNNWTHDKGMIEVTRVSSILEKCESR